MADATPVTDEGAYNKSWNKGFVAGVGSATAGTDARPTTDDEAWNEGFRSGVRAARRTRQYRAQQAQPAEPVITAVFDESALKALDLQVEKAVEKILTTSVATAELNPDFWQRLEQIIKPNDETWEKLSEFPVGTRFVRTEDGLAVEDEEADE